MISLIREILDAGKENNIIDKEKSQSGLRDVADYLSSRNNQNDESTISIIEDMCRDEVDGNSKLYSRIFALCLSIYRKNPHRYGELMWNCVRRFWDNNLISEEEFPPYLSYYSTGYNRGLTYTFRSIHNSSIDVDIIGEYPLGRIDGIEISEMIAIEKKGLGRNFLLQITPDKGAGVRENPSPDEIVYLIMDDEDRTRVKCWRCYG